MEIEEIIKGKVRFDGISDGAIFDEDNNHICDARGWGRFEKMKDGHKIHDQLAYFIAEAINEKLERATQPTQMTMEEVLEQTGWRDNIQETKK